MKALKIAVPLISIVLTFMLFIMLFRLWNGKTPFLSTRVIYNYFQTIDLWKPFNDFYNTLLSDWSSLSQQTFENVMTNRNWWDSVVSGITDGFYYLCYFCSVPFSFMWALCQYIYTILVTIKGFFDVILI